MKAYRKLRVWQFSMDLVDQIYDLCENFPASERYGLVSQMQRAAVSIPANIAEGYGREHRGDYLRHLSFARGSLMELETLLTITVRRGVCQREQAESIWEQIQATGKSLTRLIQSLKRDD